MSGFPVNLLVALATDLQTGSIGTYNPTGVYTTAQTGIVFYTMPSGPDRIVTLTDYPVADAPSLSDSVIGVQVKCRWGGADPRSASDLAEMVFQRWHGKENWILGSGAGEVRIARVSRQSGPVSLGQDANNRWLNSQNFYLYAWRPSTNRT